MAKIEQRRRLDDLFMQGVEVRFGKNDDGPWGKVGPFEGDDGRRLAPKADEVCMFVRPPNPVQREQSMREAQAKRARALILSKRDEDSEEHLTIMAFLADMSDDVLVDYVIMSNTAERSAEAEREILSHEEWKDMTSYEDAARQFSEMSPEELENNEEWAAFQELDDRYSRQISERENEIEDADREALKILMQHGREVIEKKALAKRADYVGTQAFIDEYERWMNYYSVREVDDPNMLWFANVDEYSTADVLVKERIAEALEPFISDGGTAKNSQGAASGSVSSELPEKPETSESSIPETQTA